MPGPGAMRALRGLTRKDLRHAGDQPLLNELAAVEESRTCYREWHLQNTCGEMRGQLVAKEFPDIAPPLSSSFLTLFDAVTLALTRRRVVARST